MHVTLVQPAMGRRHGRKYARPFSLRPLAIATLAGVTPPGVDLSFFDDRFEEVDLDQPTDLVGITVETFTARRAYEIAAAYRRRGIRVVLGGVHPTLLPDEAQQHADSVMVGQAEVAWPRIVEDASQRALRTRYEQDASPLMERIRIDTTLFAGKRYLPVELVEYGRGCPFRCDFCDIPVYFDGRYSTRPTADVLRDIPAGARWLLVVDDNIGARPHALRAFAEAIAPLGVRWASQASITITHDHSLLDAMAASGCYGLLIGFESLFEDNLRRMNKAFNARFDFGEAIDALQSRGIRIYGSFIVGYDHDTPERIERTVDFAIEHGLYIANFNPLIPIPRTPLYERMRSQGRLHHERWWLDGNHRYGDFLFDTPSMTADELAEVTDRAKRRFYGARATMRRALRNPASHGPGDTMRFMGFNMLVRREVLGKQDLCLGLEEAA